MKLLLALAIATAMLAPIKANAATEWMLEFTTFNPYSTQVVAGPFESSSECYAVLNQESYVQGGSYSCRMIYY